MFVSFKVLVLSLFLLPLLLRADAANDASTDASGGVPKPEVDLPFPVGESLEYDIYWGWIGVGHSVATTRWEWVEDRWMIVIRFRTTSSGIANRLYPVDDLVESFIDAETLRPVRFTTVLSAGDQHRDEETIFDWETKTAHYTRRRKGDREDDTLTYEIQENTRDLVSFMYFMRNTEFEPGEQHHFEVVVNDKLYELEANTRHYENINLKQYGRVRSLQIDPRASFEGVFVRRGEMSVWLADDPRRILTKLEVDTPWAKVKLLLRNVRGPGDDHWIEKAEDE